MTSTDIERRPLTPLDIGDTKAAQKLYQDGLQQLLDRKEDVTPIRGAGGRVKNHVNRSGVSKIATWCAISTTLVGTEIDRDTDGKGLRWRVTVRATAPDGRMADGVGSFDVKERPSKKPEHDGLAQAYTRARNRAVMDLIGMGEVSAEEMTNGGAEGDSGDTLPYGPVADHTLRVEAEQAIRYLWPEVSGVILVQAIENTISYFPEIAARTIKGLAWFLSADESGRQDAAGATPEGPEEGLGDLSGPSLGDQARAAAANGPDPVTTSEVVTGEPVTTVTVADESEPLIDDVDIDAIFDGEVQ